MSKKRVLFVTQGLKPYTELDEISELVAKLPQYTQDKGMEIRVLMPKFGLINERRHRLHEVVRLSGMNIIVDDDDFPLIIKVASLPGSRLQVYFLDNEEFFKRKFMFSNAEGNAFDDNLDRMVFFCKGVMETVKKFGWPPDIIHCHGWMTSLIPFYLSSVYKDEPIFQNSKLVYSAYNHDFGKNFKDEFFVKSAINELEESDLEVFKDGDGINLMQGAIKNAHGVIVGSENLEPSVLELMDSLDIPTLPHQAPEAYLESYIKFYKEFLGEDEDE